nr:histidine phosphatase family protein [Ancylobacter lacus]
MSRPARSARAPLSGLARAAALALGLALAAGSVSAAFAAPRRIVIVRHGEKATRFGLCDIGKERANALAAQYLSPTSPMSLIRKDPPAAFMAITLHTLETAQPIVAAWDMPIKTNRLMLEPIRNNRYFNSKINVQNRKVARDLLTNPIWHGKTVVLVWEHFHIASEALEKQFPGEQVTLRQLLNLDRIPNVPGGVPKTWPDGNFNFFWILDYANDTDTVPSSFRVVRQYFAWPYSNLPSNDWGTPEPLPADSGCTNG